MKQFQLHKKTLNRKEEELLDEMARIQMQMKDADLDTSVSHDQISQLRNVMLSHDKTSSKHNKSEVGKVDRIDEPDDMVTFKRADDEQVMNK